MLPLNEFNPTLLVRKDTCPYFYFFFCRRLFDVFLFNICSYRHRWHINTWSLAFVLTFLISNFTSICYSFTMSNSLNSNEKFDHAVHESVGSSDDEVLEKYLLAQQALEQENGIKYRTCSWQKTAALVFSEYICLAILSFPWSYSVLGLIPGLILTFVTALSTLYTGITIWEFCLKNPNVRTVCDIGQHLFWGKKWAWWFTAACFLLNNTFIQALHVLVGSKYLNSISNHALCSVVFGVIAAIICFIFSIPRTFSGLSHLASFSAATMFIAVVLCMAFAGAQEHPAGFDGTPVHWNLIPVKGTNFAAGMSAFLNIVYTLVGQITYPSFIAEMEDPRDFKKVLYLVTVAEVVVFSLAGSIVYVYVGDAYMTAPAFGSLDNVYMKVAFSFAVPTIVFLGVLYSTVSSKFIFQYFFDDTVHAKEHTAFGWAVWVLIVAGTWVIAFVIAEVIPFFSDLLSLMSSLFDTWFGFIFWGVAYFQMRGQEQGAGWWKRQGIYGNIMIGLNILLIITGLVCLGPGTYSAVQSIVTNYQTGSVSGVFSCANNGFKG